MKKEQNGRKSVRRLKPTVGCNASKRRRWTRWKSNEDPFTASKILFPLHSSKL